MICWCPSIWLLIWASYSITLFNELSPAQHMLVNCTNFVPICVIDLTLSLPIFLFINKTETQDPIIVCLDLSLQVLLGLVAIPRGVFLICWFSLSALFTEVVIFVLGNRFSGTNYFWAVFINLFTFPIFLCLGTTSFCSKIFGHWVLMNFPKIDSFLRLFYRTALQFSS